MNELDSLTKESENQQEILLEPGPGLLDLDPLWHSFEKVFHVGLSHR